MARNQRLGDAIRQRGWSVQQLAERVEVDPKTVLRWVAGGRIPQPRLRSLTSDALGVPPAVLWPECGAPATGVSELCALYDNRTELSPSTIRTMLGDAAERIDILAYSCLWLWDGVPDFADTLAAKATGGVKVRVCLGDPESDAVAKRGKEEGIGADLAARCRLALTYASAVLEACPSAVRRSGDTLYASVFRFDDDVLANIHLWGNPAACSPVVHLRHGETGGMADNVLRSFDRVWERAQPVVG